MNDTLKKKGKNMYIHKNNRTSVHTLVTCYKLR